MVETEQDIGAETEPYFAGDALQIIDDVYDEGQLRNLADDDVEWVLETRLNRNEVLSDQDSGVSATITDPQAGEITIRIDGGVTTGMEGRYRHRVKVIDQSGAPATVSVGRFRIS